MVENFGKALCLVATQLRIPLKDHKIFLKDVDMVSNFINKALIQQNSIFAHSFTNLPETATFMGNTYIDVPAKFNCYLILDFKYAHQVEFGEDGYVYLSADCQSTHAGSRIPSTYLQQVLRDDLNNILGSQPLVKCQEHTYKLCFHTTVYPISAHTIVATQMDSETNVRIVFDFLLAFKIPLLKVPRPKNVPVPESMPSQALEYWLALPVNHFDVHFNGQNHLGRMHIWQVANLEQRQRWRLALRLSYMLSTINDTLSTVGIHGLKHTCVNLCERYGLKKADKPINFKLIDMMSTYSSLKLTELSTALNSGSLVNFQMDPQLSTDCLKTDVMISKMHDEWKTSNCVPSKAKKHSK
ncbi:uncharacterized protein LOC132789206 [Drosophila nasuta]|uniref:uncharacterized protein LOC132789206 n=1 Tax=Drosophila nasuta TaxID=42062 RepID=UPI00295E58F9|nr:uncharacterized protein LOC132789206 [Drosophila nasuta]XP_060653044.1 uncharacterized protein LOC132789206 [Drosophila nasuta]XP_060653045.1 uncharacterized protein LOC132789206 [Drosophila nasuta]